MEFINEFRVPVSIDHAWEVLTDVERVVPCIPGAQLLSVDGDESTGVVKVKIGPVTVQYKGKAVFAEKDASLYRVVIRANGKETRGQGHADGVVTAELKDEGDTTLCLLITDLTVSGRAAQFGRGVLSEVSTKLIGQFAERLKADVLADSTVQPATETAGSTTVSAASQPDEASIDLLSVVAAPLAKRVIPVAGGLAVGLAIGYLLGRRS